MPSAVILHNSRWVILHLSYIIENVWFRWLQCDLHWPFCFQLQSFLVTSEPVSPHFDCGGKRTQNGILLIKSHWWLAVDTYVVYEHFWGVSRLKRRSICTDSSWAGYTLPEITKLVPVAKILKIEAQAKI